MNSRLRPDFRDVSFSDVQVRNHEVRFTLNSRRREFPRLRPKSATSAESRQLAPFDPVYVNRLQEAFEMAGTNVCDMQAIPDAILDGT